MCDAGAEPYPLPLVTRDPQTTARINAEVLLWQGRIRIAGLGSASLAVRGKVGVGRSELQAAGIGGHAQALDQVKHLGGAG